VPLTRRIRKRSGSVSVVLPKAIADMLDLHPGDAVSFEIVGRDSILLRLHPRAGTPRPDTQTSPGLSPVG
jgi:antitoxin component of MazEF toxin-antitoxin module